MLLIVPLLSIAHYALFFELAFEDPENKIKTWLIMFPMIGVLNISLYIYFVADGTVQMLMEGMDDERIEKGKMYDFKSLLNEASSDSRKKDQDKKKDKPERKYICCYERNAKANDAGATKIKPICEEDKAR